MFKGQTVKILLIGPVQSGKSTIANFLGDREDVLGGGYRPTVGVRVVEFEKEAPKNPRRPGQEKVLVELWDMSGDSRYPFPSALRFDNGWPAIQKGAQGIIFVYNADNPKHEQELEGWVNSFPKKIGIPATLCVGFAHHLSGKPIKGTSKLRNLLLYAS
jgi:GTPase SAR1 family protein